MLENGANCAGNGSDCVPLAHIHPTTEMRIQSQKSVDNSCTIVIWPKTFIWNKIPVQGLHVIGEMKTRMDHRSILDPHSMDSANYFNLSESLCIISVKIKYDVYFNDLQWKECQISTEPLQEKGVNLPHRSSSITSLFSLLHTHIWGIYRLWITSMLYEIVFYPLRQFV